MFQVDKKHKIVSENKFLTPWRISDTNENLTVICIENPQFLRFYVIK